MTRNKHAATVSEMQGRYDALAVEKAQAEAEAEAKIKDKDDRILGLETELELYKEGAEKSQAELQSKLAKRKAEIAALRKQQELIEANLRQYKGLRDAFEKMIGAGEIEVYRRRGRIMVALPSSVLFPSGKASLSPAGSKALAQVAGVLAKLEGRRFLVAGHTDNVPISTSQFQDNWQLSTARATIVTRFLIENGMQPTSVAAAGYGEYDPIRNNDSAANRKRNRRIEIILMPNIDELPELPE
ncbi:OmpA family protein [Haliangium sp.]|uniref:OmpA/MotB family protein n=1 Tax=Haliangium sp. TaxID=2663208 RepID=UPI003D118092